jgi:hypothetical protein
MNGDIGRLLDMAGWTPHGTSGQFDSKYIHLHPTASFPYSNPESPLESLNMMMDQRYTTQDFIVEIISFSYFLYVFVLH